MKITFPKKDSHKGIINGNDYIPCSQIVYSMCDLKNVKTVSVEIYLLCILRRIDCKYESDYRIFFIKNKLVYSL